MAGTIADQSEMACAAAAASSAADTAVVTEVVGAVAAVDSIGFADVPVEELDELVAGVVDVEPDVPDDAVPVEVLSVPVEVLPVPVEVLPVPVEVLPVPVEVLPVPADVLLVPVEVLPVPVDVLSEDGEPTVTVCVVEVPLVVVVVVPLLFVVVVVEVLVADVGHDTDWAWITTPGPKLQLLDAGGVAVALVLDAGVL